MKDPKQCIKIEEQAEEDGMIGDYNYDDYPKIYKGFKDTALEHVNSLTPQDIQERIDIAHDLNPNQEPLTHDEVKRLIYKEKRKEAFNNWMVEASVFNKFHYFKKKCNEANRKKDGFF